MANATVVELPPITELADFTESINMLIYGDSGSGKTVLGGTAPKALIIATENGTISAKRMGSNAKTIRVATWKELANVYKAIAKGDERFSEFEWFVLDSATEMQQLCLRQILDTAVADNPSRDPDIPAIQDHQKWQNMFKRFVKAFNDLPQNVLWTATAMRKEDEEGEDLILPDIQGKDYAMASWFCASMHAVGYLGVKTKVTTVGERKTREDYRRIIFKRSGPYFAKDRYGVLAPLVDNPNMTEISERITASEGSERPDSTTPATRRRRAS